MRHTYATSDLRGTIVSALIKLPRRYSKEDVQGNFKSDVVARARPGFGGFCPSEIPQEWETRDEEVLASAEPDEASEVE